MTGTSSDPTSNRSDSSLAFTRPSTARMYNYYLGGKSWFDVDRAAAEAVLRSAPDAGAVARENFLFAGRAAAWAAKTHGIGQVLDIGAGILSGVPLPSVEDHVHQACPGAVVVGCDNDPVVLAHARGLRTGYKRVLEGDVRDLGTIFGNPDLKKALNIADPMVVVLAAVLHFVPDDQVNGVVDNLRRRLAPGSVLVMSHATSSATDQRRVSGMEQAYDDATSRIHFRTEEEITGLLVEWDVVDPPALCDVARWGLPTPHHGQPGRDVRVVGMAAVLPDHWQGQVRAPGGVR
ncbi:SAM-dependent methyltransferase [Spirillospora sp. NPDC048832]